MTPTREEAQKILNDMVKNQNLKRHMYAVEAVMKAYARKFDQDEEKWGIAGLLHDADWESNPDVHPKIIVKKLEEMDVDPEIVNAITSHGDNSPEWGSIDSEREKP